MNKTNNTTLKEADKEKLEKRDNVSNESAETIRKRWIWSTPDFIKPRSEYFDKSLSSKLPAFNSIQKHNLEFEDEEIKVLEPYSNDAEFVSIANEQRVPESKRQTLYNNVNFVSKYGETAFKNIVNNYSEEEAAEYIDLLLKQGVLEPHREILNANKDQELYFRMLNLESAELANLLKDINNDKHTIKIPVFKGLDSKGLPTYEYERIVPVDYVSYWDRGVSQDYKDEYGNELKARLPRMHHEIKDPGLFKQINDALLKSEKQQAANILRNSQSEIYSAEKELIRNFTPAQIDELFDELAEKYIPSYLEFKDQDGWLETSSAGFSRANKLRYLAEASVLQNKNPYLAHIYSNTLNDKMISYIKDQQGLPETLRTTWRSFWTGLATDLLDAGHFLRGARFAVSDFFTGDNKYDRYLAGDPGLEGRVWGKLSNPEYLRKVKAYNTFDSEEIASAEKHGISKNAIVRDPNNLNAWGLTTVHDVLSMGHYIASMALVGGTSSKVLNVAGKGIKVATKINTAGKAYKALKKCETLGQLLGFSYPMVGTMVSSTFEETLNELNSKIDNNIEDNVNRKLQEHNYLLQENKEKYLLDFMLDNNSENNARFTKRTLEFIGDALKDSEFDSEEDFVKTVQKLIDLIQEETPFINLNKEIYGNSKNK